MTTPPQNTNEPTPIMDEFLEAHRVNRDITNRLIEKGRDFEVQLQQMTKARDLWKENADKTKAYYENQLAAARREVEDLKRAMKELGGYP